MQRRYWTMSRDTGVMVPGVLLMVHPSIKKQAKVSEQHANLR
jgi:hypothetical protein